MGFLGKIKRYAALASGNFEKIFKDKEVPPLPEAIMKLLEKLRDPEVNMDEIATIIGNDPGLSTQILRVVNSAMYGLRGQITSIKKAIAILGLKKVEHIAISFGVMKSVKDPKREGFDFNFFWSVSLYRAIIAREIARETDMGDPDEAFTASMLQDIALPVLLSDWFDVYKKVYEKWRNSNAELHEIEDQELSWNHAQAGAWLAKKWELPAILVCCIGLHIESLEKIKALELWGTSVVPVNISSKVPIKHDESKVGELVKSAEEIGITNSELAKLGNKCYDILSEVADAFGIKELKVDNLASLLEQHAH